MSKSFKTRIVQRIYRTFLDVMVLKLVQNEPMWGYKIIKCVEEQREIRLRHSALYPLLGKLEKDGFLRSSRKAKNGRVRKIYNITSKGIQLVNAYNEFLTEELKSAH
ncbi:MAG: helix-turn-helix transcriptional regulator [Candidatus Bathyarchaeota archaeon]|nr:MAG: helix-turn-helix transcriptional regulator [Candidatus Bathyarchaeota archaeon]